MRQALAVLAVLLLQLAGPLAAQPGADRGVEAAKAPAPEAKAKPAPRASNPKKAKPPSPPRKAKKA